MTRLRMHEHAARRRMAACISKDMKLKRQFETRKDAKALLKKINNQEMQPYKCTFCGKWHVGRPRRG